MTAAVTTDREHTSSPHRLDPLTWTLIAVALLPLVIAAIRVLTQFDGYLMTSDNAMNELIVRDLGKHPVLLGPYSRSGWSHPGPLMFYLFWTPYRMFGSNSSAMLAAALVINGAAIGTSIAIARRWGGLALAMPMTLAFGLLILRLPHDYLASPWNPYLTALPFGAFLLASWAATCGDRWAFPVAAFIGTFCMQTHIGYVAIVAPVLAWCAWRAIRDQAQPRSSGAGTRGLTSMWWALSVLAVLWAPTVIEQFVRHPGNLRAAWHYFRTSTEPAHSIRDGYRIVAAQFTLRPDWMFGPRPVSAYAIEPPAILSRQIPALIVPFAVAAWATFRSRAIAARRLFVTLLIVLGAGVVSLARTIGPMFDYRLRWVWVVAAMCMAVTAATAIEWLRPRMTGRVATGFMSIGVAVTCLLSALGIANAASADPPDVDRTTATTALSRQVLRHLPPPPGVVLIRSTSFVSLTVIPGIALTLERAGIPVKVDDSDASRLTFGRHRIYKGDAIRAVVLIAEDADIERIADTPGARRIAYVSAVDGDERRRAIRELARMSADERAEFSSPRMIKLSAKLAALAVFTVPKQTARP